MCLTWQHSQCESQVVSAWCAAPFLFNVFGVADQLCHTPAASGLPGWMLGLYQKVSTRTLRVHVAALLPNP
jgi:hypothetical protein